MSGDDHGHTNEVEQWRRRGRHFDRVFRMEVSPDGRTAISVTALGELARLVPDRNEASPPVVLDAAEVQRLLALAGYAPEEVSL